MPSLSVLIPVFNCEVASLVHSLVAQVPDWPGPVEIRLIDDGSEQPFREANRQLGSLTGVDYRELPRNVGRAAIRNYLAAAAQHEWLLLLDNDSHLPDIRFLTRYVEVLPQATVFIGGTCYAAAPPAAAALRLRWRYGRARETRPATVRQAHPYGQFTINNALIRADVFRRFPLDERLTGYGHEDTKFGADLAAADLTVRHIDNPVRHDGLEPAAVFLQKSEQAVRNLVRMFRQDELGGDSQLLRTAVRLRRLGLAPAALAALTALAPTLRRQLLSSAPRLRVFDLLKLYWLLRELA